ncbi:mitochondrial carrier protein, partial [Eremomyces bilateralis CBS 781.70]
AGAVAAFSVDLIVYPLDTLKTRIQSPSYRTRYLDAKTQAVNRHALFRGLYQGVGMVVIATLPSSGAFFTTYEAIKATLTRINPTLPSASIPFLPTPIIHATASSIAELVSCAILTPAEVIKQNAQMLSSTSCPSTPSSLLHSSPSLLTLRKFRSHPLHLWHGYSALASRNLPFTALQFPLFEQLKLFLRGRLERSGRATGSLWETTAVTAGAAGMAGSVAAWVTTPVDVVKTRVMLRAAEATGNGNGNRDGKPILDATGHRHVRVFAKSESSWAVGKRILAEEGARGLFRGGALRFVWTLAGSGLYLGVYETGRVYLARRRGEKLNEGDML